MRAMRGLQEGAREVVANLRRSAIAVLAVVLGVASLLSTLSMSAGMAKEERKFIVDLGGLEHFYIEDRPIAEGERKKEGVSPGRTYRDIETLRKMKGVVRLSTSDHFIEVPGGLRYQGKSSGNPWVVGTDDSYFPVYNHTLVGGRALTPLDLELRNRVCVLGSDVVEQLGIPAGTATGRIVSLGGVPFHVVGELSKYPFKWKNRHVPIPLTTAQAIFRKVDQEAGGIGSLDPRLGGISVVIEDIDRMDESIEQIRSMLRHLHNGIEDFGFNTEEDWSDAIEGRVMASRVSGGLVALVSLFVGGVGIANVMLASMRRRMWEIGLRRAVGATRLDIFVQLISETLLLGVAGGVLGILAGWLLAVQLAGISQGSERVVAPLLEREYFFWSFLAGVIVSVAAGLYPAWKGSRVTPGLALRAE